MMRQILGSLWLPPRGEVSRAGTDHLPYRTDPARPETAVWQMTDPDGEVDMLFLEADHPVALVQADIHIGVSLQERCDQRHHMNSAEDDRRGRCDQLTIKLSMAAASAVSFSVTPPASWVVRVISTWL